MKRIVLYIIGAFVAEIAVIAIATIFGFSGTVFYVAVLILPASLFIGACVYLGYKYFKGSGEEETGENESGNK